MFGRIYSTMNHHYASTFLPSWWKMLKHNYHIWLCTGWKSLPKYRKSVAPQLNIARGNLTTSYCKENRYRQLFFNQDISGEIVPSPNLLTHRCLAFGFPALVARFVSCFYGGTFGTGFNLGKLSLMINPTPLGMKGLSSCCQKKTEMWNLWTSKIHMNPSVKGW